MQSIFAELEPKGLLGVYTEEKILKMLKRAIRLRVDPAYKSRVLSWPMTAKSHELLAFTKDARESLQRLRYLPAEKTMDTETEELEEALRVLVEARKSHRRREPYLPPAPVGLSPKRSRSLHAESRNDATNSEAAGDSLREIRCRSCACRDCGGIKYYQRVGRRLRVLDRVRVAPDASAEYHLEKHNRCDGRARFKNGYAPTVPRKRESRTSVAGKIGQAIPRPSFLTESLPEIKSNKEVIRDLNNKLAPLSTAAFHLTVPKSRRTTHRNLQKLVYSPSADLESLVQSERPMIKVCTSQVLEPQRPPKQQIASFAGMQHQATTMFSEKKSRNVQRRNWMTSSILPKLMSPSATTVKLTKSGILSETTGQGTQKSKNDQKLRAYLSSVAAPHIKRRMVQKKK